jgi:Ser/Thr protein kinase RdoA (MazF antagonist)
MHVSGTDGMATQFLANAVELLVDPLAVDTPVTFTPIASTARSNVYRVNTAKQHAILKLTSDRESALRELAVYASWGSVAEIPMPQILGGGTTEQFGWVLYEDADLVAPRWTRRLWTQVGELAARIHTRFGPSSPATWSPPTTFQSHTPSFPAVVATVWSPVVDEALRTISDFFPLSAHQATFLQNFLARVREWRMDEPQDPVYCHGDLHIGNIMSSRSTGQLYVIDWSFLHLDDPCFDLFQFLDATSPTTELRRYGSRMDVLSAYHQNREGMTESLPNLVQRYIRYAAVHLFWILTRIADDAVHHRFPLANLQRQTRETVQALRALSRMNSSRQHGGWSECGQ